MPSYLAAFPALAERLAAQGIDVPAVIAALTAQRIETPSWGYADSGTRFGVFAWPGAARTIHQKLQMAAQVQRLTGVCPSVALHIPWDQTDDWAALGEYAAGLGLRLGAINPNLFQEQEYKLGSLCHPSAAVRDKAVRHVLDCIEIARATRSTIISLWLADGANYAGQDDMRERRNRLLDGLRPVYAALPAGMRLLIEYKFFEPAFYHTDLADWGMALLLANKLGPQAQVLVDTGHHAPGVNVEQIVALLLDEGRLGGFHFNDRKYADDDLMAGASNPFALFLIYNELAADPVAAADVAYMIDQSHNVEGKFAPMVQSVCNVQTAYAKALLVDRTALRRRQQEGDVLGAHRTLLDAYETDVRPLLAEVRRQLGVPEDPVAAALAG